MFFVIVIIIISLLLLLLLLVIVGKFFELYIIHRIVIPVLTMLDVCHSVSRLNEK